MRGQRRSGVLGGAALRGREVEGDVDDHVLLAADELAPADLEQDRAHVDAVALRRGLGVAQEARVDAA